MKKLLLVIVVTGFCIQAGAAQDLNGVTFGFGAGYSHNFDKTYDYSLTPDGKYDLKVQGLNKNAFVISSVVMVKLGKLFTDQESKLLKPDHITPAKWYDKLSVNLSLNLLNVASDVSFNKSIDGGLGVGYFLTSNLQAAVFYDVTQRRQLRDYVLQSYENKPIPNGAGTVYNALDASDDKLFYNRTVDGLSFKLVFSLGNKKVETPQPAK